MIWVKTHRRTPKTNMIKAVIAILTFLIWTASGWAGTLKGTIQFTGQTPAPKVHETGRFSKVCGPEIVDNSLLVENKNVKNVVVWLSGKDAKKLKGDGGGEYILDQKKCAYDPHIVALPKDSELQIHTSDPINHNIHTYSFDNDPINIMFVPGQDHAQEFEEPEVVKVECDLHSWMHAWIVVTPNPYYAVTDSSGAFQIPDIPPGKYTLNIWHEVLGSKTKKIKVGDGNSEENFEFTELAETVTQN